MCWLFSGPTYYNWNHNRPLPLSKCQYYRSIKSLKCEVATWLEECIKEHVPGFVHFGRPKNNYRAFNHRSVKFDATNKSTLRRDFSSWFTHADVEINYGSLEFLRVGIVFIGGKRYVEIDLWDFIGDAFAYETVYPHTKENQEKLTITEASIIKDE